MPRAVAALVCVLLAVPLLAGRAEAGEVAPDARTALRDIVFPIIGGTTYRGTFGACRARCTRSHEGTDVFAPQLAPLVATRDSTVVHLVTEPADGGIYGNNLTLEDDEGWTYRYVHLNNDSPGTDDGRNPREWITPDGIEVGARVIAGQVVAYVGDSGNSEGTTHHLHFEIHKPGDLIIDPFPSLQRAPTLDWPVQPEDATTIGGLLDRIADDIGRDRIGDVDRAIAVTRFRAGLGHAVVVDLLGTPGWHERVMDQTYRLLLDRGVDPDGSAFWAAHLDAGATAEDLTVAVLTSDEYRRRAGHDDQAWLHRLFRDLFARDVDPRGERYWLGVLDETGSRQVVARALLEHPTAHPGRASSPFTLVLGRDPSPSAAEYWGGEIARSGHRAVAAALFLSTEYAAG